MSNEMPYAEQEEICYQWLRFRPQMTEAEATTAFRAVFAITLTHTNYARAKERLDALPLKPKTEKQKYVVALGSMFPGLAVKQVKTKCLLFFGQDIRDDLVTYWQKYAEEFPMARSEAKALVEGVEQRRAGGQAGFGLEDAEDSTKEVDL